MKIIISIFIFSCLLLVSCDLHRDEDLVLSQENLLSSHNNLSISQVLLFDDFNFFDDTKWNKITKGNGTSDDGLLWQWQGGDNVYTSDGHLTLLITKEGNRVYCGRVDSKQQFGYGWYEARFKIPTPGKGVQGSFWTKNYGAGNSLNELDIVETYGYASAYETTVHWGAPNGAPGHQSTNEKVFTPLNQYSYRTWKMEWQNSSLKFYYENELKWTYQGEGLPPNAPMTAILSTEAFQSIQGSPLNATYPMKCFVDYVKIWTDDAAGNSSITIDNGGFGYNDSGNWVVSTASGAYGDDYKQDGNSGQTTYKWATFKPASASAPLAGNYKIKVYWKGHPNRASNATVRIYHSAGTESNSFGTYNDIVVDMKTGNPDEGQFNQIGGTYNMVSTDYVAITNTGANGYVIADAVQFELIN